MKKKVTVNRKKISSEEIGRYKDFRSLMRNYPSVFNPFRRTSWRTKSILWVMVISVVLVFYVSNPGC